MYLLNAKVIARFLRRVEMLVCYRCGSELVENQWVYAKRAQGDCTVLKEQKSGWLRNHPKVYHLKCAKEVHLVD